MDRSFQKSKVGSSKVNQNEDRIPYLPLLNEISKLLSSTTDSCLNISASILSSLKEKLNVCLYSLFLVEHRRPTLILSSTVLVPSQWKSEISKKMAGAYSKLTNHQVDLNQISVMDKLVLEPASHRGEFNGRLGDLTTVPLIVMEKCIGLMGFLPNENAYFAPEDHHFFKVLAHEVAMFVEHDRIQELIASERNRLEAILKNMPSGVLVVNGDGEISLVNPAIESLLGVDAEKLIGHTIKEVVIQTELKELFDMARTGGGDLIAKEMPIRDLKNNATKMVKVHLANVRNHLGEVSGRVLVLDDVTRELEVENLKSEFVSTVSHELRTPMTIIREGVSQILDGLLGETTEEQRQFLTITLQGIDRLNHIVSDLLDISKLESGKTQISEELIDIVAVAKAAITSFVSQVRANGIQIRTFFPAEHVELYADREKISQVFKNLIGNALKFTAKGQIDIAVAEEGNVVECSVSDTGKGIASEDLPKVFDKFQQFGRTAGPGEKGTGLGLAICKGIVELHRGKIWAQSELGKGTKFTFVLPKSTAHDLLTDYVGQHLNHAIQRESFLSIIVLHVSCVDEEGGAIRRPTPALVQGLKKLVRECLRRKGDKAIEETNGLFVVLPETEKENALVVTGRIRQVVDDYLTQQGLAQKIKVAARVASYPEDGATTEELLKKIG